MLKIVSFAQQLKSDRKGVTALEYGLIAALIAVVIIGAVQTLGTDIQGVFQSVSNAISPPAPTTP